MTNTDALIENLRTARRAYYAALDAAITGAGYAQARTALLAFRRAERAVRVARNQDVVPAAA